MPRPLKSYFLALIGLCVAVNLCLTVLVVGIDVTPWETKDSQGRTMGFNDRFSPEHYRIALGNFHPAALFKWQYSYEWLLLAAQGVALWCLWSEPRSARRATRWFFLVQPAVFFIGTISLVFLMPPNLLADVLSFRADRETFIDIPFLELMAQAPWVIVSWTIAVALPGQSLGLGEAWAALLRRLRKPQPLPAHDVPRVCP